MEIIFFIFLISTFAFLIQQVAISSILLKQSNRFADGKEMYHQVILKNTDELENFDLKSNSRIFKPLTKSLNFPPVSIVICAKNEADTIKTNIESVLTQNYPCFEVIVVNDCSEDSTVSVVQDFQHTYKHLELIQLTTKSSNSKREALKMGILKSKYDIILLTDADCTPISKDWISSMVSLMSSSTSCVLGYSPYVKLPSYLNQIIQFETLQTACLYLSRAAAGQAYMSVGRNVMYTKELFLKSENFENEKHLTSGDDDLLIQNIKDKSQIDICLAPKSFVLSRPKTSFKSWWAQKLRHYSTSAFYKTSNRIFLGSYHASLALFWLTFGILMLGDYSEITLQIVIIAIAIKSMLMVRYIRIFKISKSILWLWPILEVSLIILQVGLGINGRFKTQDTWQ